MRRMSWLFGRQGRSLEVSECFVIGRIAKVPGEEGLIVLAQVLDHERVDFERGAVVEAMGDDFSGIAAVFGT